MGAATPPYYPQKDRVLGKLLRCAQRAAVSNPRINGVMASPPTISQDGNSAPAGQTNNYTYLAHPEVFRIFGGAPVSTAGGYRIKSAVIATTGGNLGTSNGAQSLASRNEFMADAAKVTVRVGWTTLKYRFLVDGQYVDLTGTGTLTTVGNGVEYISLTFASRALRRIAIEMQGGTCGFTSAHVGPTESIFASDGGDLLTGALLTDSYGSSNATLAADAYGVVMADRLGIRNMLISSSGGTGWATSEASAYAFGTRVTNGDLALAGAPDILFLQGSYNDRNNAPATITANCLAALQTLRRSYPHAPAFILGAFPGNTGPSAGVLAAENAVSAAVTSFADPLARFIPLSTAASGALISGTGKIGTTTSVGNSDIYTDTDGVHPPTVGHAFIGQWASAQVLAAAQSMLG